MKPILSQKKLLNSLGAWLLIAAGLCLALFGLLLDLILLRSQPGIGLPQLLIAVLGVVLACVGWLLRRDNFRKRLTSQLRANLGKSVLIVLLTVAALELALTVAGYSTYYPVELEETYNRIVDWWLCDEQGCRYNIEAARRACQNGEGLSGRHCVFNSSGYADTDEFTASDELLQNRVLFLGDSWTHGFNADVGHSFVETVESHLPYIAVWNAGIISTGTNQALVSYRRFAPIMQPQLTILGFFPANDFRDNRLGVGKAFGHTASDRIGGVASMNTELDGRWGGLYEAAPTSVLGYRRYEVNPPPNELERLIGLTRLGSILLRSLDVFSPLFDEQRWREQVDITRDILRQLRDEAAALDSELLVLMIRGRDSYPTPTEKVLTGLELLAELNIPYIEVYDLVTVEEHFHARNHWNNEGHGIVGKALADCIEDFFAAGSLSACDQVVVP